jgi:hypothetical protein
VLDAVVVDETDLDNVTVISAERRVDDAFDIATDADERHLALGELSAETISDVGGVFRSRALLGELGRTGRRHGRPRFSRLRHMTVSGGRWGCVHRVPRVGNCQCEDEQHHGKDIDH